MSYSPTAGPMSWVSTRYGHCYKRITPGVDTGMFLTMNKNLSPRLRNKSPDQVKEERKQYSAKYYAYVKLIQRQKPKMQTFTGEIYIRDHAAKSRTAREVGRRLHKAMNIYQPAESRPRPSTAPPTINFLVRKPVYTRNEIEAIFDKLSECENQEKNANDSGPNDEQEDPKAKAMKKFRKGQLYYPADDVRNAIEEFLSDDKSGKREDNKAPVHRPFSARSCAHASDHVKISRNVESCENKRSKDDIKSTSDRLAKDEHKNESETGKTRRVQSAPPERSRSKKVTKEELDSIIERLTKYDKDRWPPESRGAGRIRPQDQ